MGLDELKQLRQLTSLGIADCKKALEEAGGDFQKALSFLKKRGVSISEKKKDRITSQGIVASYVHFGGNLGSLVEINCESDFVAKNETFKQFAKDIALHIAAASPKYISRDDIPQDILSSVDNIEEYIKNNCLLEQDFVKNTQVTIKDYLTEVISQIGEKVVIKRFCRFAVGE